MSSRIAAIVLWGVCVAIGCSSGTRADGPTGTVSIALAAVPADVGCLAISVQGTRAVSRQFDVSADTQPTFTMTGLPLGAVSIAGQTFPDRCASVSSQSVATWVSDPAAVTIQAGIVVQVTLTMHRNGRASIQVDFSDGDGAVPPPDAGAGGIGGTGGAGQPDAGAAGAPAPDAGTCPGGRPPLVPIMPSDPPENLVDIQAADLNDRGQIVGYMVVYGPTVDAFIWQNGVFGKLGIPNSRATAINNKGQVTGVSDSKPFFWDAGTVRFPAGLTGLPSDINDAGQVVGTAVVNGQAQAFLWDTVSDTVTVLPGLGAYTQAALINSAGLVIGTSQAVSAGPVHGVLWQAGQVIDMGFMGGNGMVRMSAVNSSGQVVGWGEVPGGQYHAFLWDHGVLHDLGATAGGGSSEAEAINDSGQIAGEIGGDDGTLRPVLWTTGGTMQELGTLGGTFGFAGGPHAISPSGEVVGGSLGTDGLRHVFVWQNGILRDLGSLGPLAFATGINAHGQIMGTYIDREARVMRAFAVDLSACQPK